MGFRMMTSIFFVMEEIVKVVRDMRTCPTSGPMWSKVFKGGSVRDVFCDHEPRDKPQKC